VSIEGSPNHGDSTGMLSIPLPSPLDNSTALTVNTGLPNSSINALYDHDAPASNSIVEEAEEAEGEEERANFGTTVVVTRKSGTWSMLISVR
jgi:hypothetical protein